MNTAHAKRVYLEQIKRLVPLTMVLARYGIELRRQGHQLYGPCPIHGGSNKRQFSVNPATSEWHCFGDCHRGGAMLEFVAAAEGTDIFEAATLVASWFAINAVTHQTEQQQRRRTMSESNKPTWKLYSAQKREGEKDFLTRIGSGWEFKTKDGRQGLNIQLSALPIGDRVVAFEGDDNDEAEEDKSSKRRK